VKTVTASDTIDAHRAHVTALAFNVSSRRILTLFFALCLFFCAFCYVNVDYYVLFGLQDDNTLLASGGVSQTEMTLPNKYPVVVLV
jgi:hypothetical protein